MLPGALFFAQSLWIIYFYSGGGDLPEPLPFRNFVAHARGGNDDADHEQYFAELLGVPWESVDIAWGNTGFPVQTTFRMSHGENTSTANPTNTPTCLTVTRSPL